MWGAFYIDRGSMLLMVNVGVVHMCLHLFPKLNNVSLKKIKATCTVTQPCLQPKRMGNYNPGCLNPNFLFIYRSLCVHVYPKLSATKLHMDPLYFLYQFACQVRDKNMFCVQYQKQ
jgi:hypothetical protein